MNLSSLRKEFSKGDIGLQVNRVKSEIISKDPEIAEAMVRAAPGLRIVHLDQAALLGSPLSMEGIDSAIRRKTEALRIMSKRFPHLHSHYAFCLLIHASTLPKLLYIFRSSPCFLSRSSLREFDRLQRAMLSDIANVDLVFDDRSWIQASLPVKSGDLRIRS